MTYEPQTWALTIQTVNKLTTHRAMDKSMIDISLKYGRQNKRTRQRTNVTDIVQRISHLKCFRDLLHSECHKNEQIQLVRKKS